MTAARTRVRIKGTRLYTDQLVQRRAFEPAFDAGSAGRRVRKWAASSSGINSLVVSNLSSLRSRSRDLVRKNPWALQGVETYAANLVGTGIKPLCRAPDAAFRAAIQELWLDWTDEADASGELDLYGMQRLAARSMLEAGEVLIRMRPRRPEDGLTVPLQYQIIEADHLPHDRNERLPNGHRIIAGVEFDLIGRRAAYHLYRDHPSEILGVADSGNTVRVPADQVLHVFKPMRPGQVRGYPWLTPVLLRIRDMLEYEDAELVRKKFAAMVTAFLRTASDAPEEIVGKKLEEYEGAVTAEAAPEVSLEPGTTHVLLPGEEMQFTEAADVGQSYDAFLKWQLRAIAAGIGCTYEQLTGDLSGVNFSSIRAGLNEFQRRCEADQEQLLAFKLCRPMWQAFVRECLFAGLVQAPGFVERPAPWLRVLWTAPGWRYVNPVQEEAANQSAIRNGTKSRRQVVSELGRDVEQVDEEIAADNARADKLGLILDTDPRKTNTAGSAQAVLESSLLKD